MNLNLAMDGCLCGDDLNRASLFHDRQQLDSLVELQSVANLTAIFKRIENDARQKKTTWSKVGWMQESAPNMLMHDLEEIIAGYHEVVSVSSGCRAGHNGGKRGQERSRAESRRTVSVLVTSREWGSGCSHEEGSIQ